MHYFSVAPMMDLTDKHCRFFHRLLSKNAILYTEMITADAVIHGNRDKLLDYNSIEHPVILQLGGSDKEKLMQATLIAQDYQYDAINLNVGCPSDRVQSGAFGACLMKTPHHVADLIHAMQNISSVPITVKCRIGVDEDNPSERLPHFIEVISKAGCKTFIIHARKAWLKGLSPKDNREIPSLDYDLVYHIKKSFPHLHIGINGGITTIEQAKNHLKYVDEVMIGRSCYATPALLMDVDKHIYNQNNITPNYHDIIQKMIEYSQQQIEQGIKFYSIIRHMLGLFHGMPNAKKWRRILSEKGTLENASPYLIKEAFQEISENMH